MATRGDDGPEVTRLLDEAASALDSDRFEDAIDLARRGEKLARRTGDAGLAAELLFVWGAALAQLGMTNEALAKLEEAEKELPDSLDVLVEKAAALFELCRFDDARRVLLRAEAIDPGDAYVHHYLGLLAERLGDAEEAARRFARARRCAPGEMAKPVSLSQDQFDEAVEDALERVPERVRRYLSNVSITVENVPSDEDLLASDPPLSPEILGLFRGAPFGEKASMDPWSHFPSAIVLYQKNLERFARSRAELTEEIGITLVHEVGHFLGLDEEDLYERGLD